jgi:hypothetical protein
MFSRCPERGFRVEVISSGRMPEEVESAFARNFSEPLTVLNPGDEFSSSPGMKQRLTRPLGKYIMTNLLAGPGSFLDLASDGKKGRVKKAPLHARNFLLEKFFIKG